jgi:polysaccharide export outer membrane protein
MRSLIHCATFFALVVVLAACGRLPASGPIVEDVIRESEAATPDFAIYPVTRSFLPVIAHWPATGKTERLSWIKTSAGPRHQLIQPGDALNIRIWDSSDNSLLTAPEQREIELPEVEVSSAGTIFLPYVGKVSVVGLTPDLAREELQSALEAIIPSAQVQLGLTEGRYNSVDLVGGVNQPGSYPMPDRNYSVLSLLAAGGGVRNDLNNPQIRLVRGNQIFGTSVSRLLDSPSLDTRLRGGDRVFVEEDNRYFLSFGASGKQDLHPFTKDTLSAMDAVAIMGGVNARLADPQGLLILREYPTSAVAAGQRGPRQRQVVFTVNLTSADGLFSARNFTINPDDLLVATESPVNDALTISNIIGNLFGIFSRAGAL